MIEGSDEEIIYTNWMTTTGEPNEKRYGNCARMVLDPEYKGLWRDIPCTRKFMFMCEKGSK